MDDEDIVVLNARVIDKYGNPVTTDNTTQVLFEIESGNAEFVGENPSISKAGITSILIKISSLERLLRIRGKAKSLGSYSIEITRP